MLVWVDEAIHFSDVSIDVYIFLEGNLAVLTTALKKFFMSAPIHSFL